MSGSIRLFVRHRLESGATVPATAAQGRYLLTVMRRTGGDPVRLFNGIDGEWRARISRLGRDGVLLTPEERLRAQATDGPELWLAFALLKRDATDLVVQKATELGVAGIQPVITARTNAARVNLERLGAIAVEAAEQSERLTVPEVRPPAPLLRFLEAWPQDRVLYAAIERNEAPAPVRAEKAAGLVVGPEGGWSEEERISLLSQDFVHPISLGPLVLRAETACIAGLVLLQAGRGH